MAVQTEFIEDGIAITDELVVCSNPVVINAVTYYAGWLMGITKDELLGSTNPDYGAWTLASKAGTRFDVLKLGVPGANECVIDKTQGRILASVQGQTLYLRYIGHGRMFQWWEQQGLSVVHPSGIQPTAADIDIWDEEELEYGGGFVGAQVVMKTGPVGDDMVYRIQTSSGEGSQYEDVTVSAGDNSSEFTAFSSRLKYQPGEHLRVTALQAASLTNYPDYAKIILQAG